MATATVAAAPALLSLEEYLHTAYSPDADFVDGVVEERNLGERDHARLQTLITVLFGSQEEELGLLALVEPRLRVAPDRVRICDFCLLRQDAPYERVLLTPPTVCIEIMSPEDRLSRAIKVLADYRAMGVPHIWLIDPQERLVYRFDANGLHQQQDRVLRAEETTIVLDVNALFERLDHSNKTKEL